MSKNRKENIIKLSLVFFFEDVYVSEGQIVAYITREESLHVKNLIPIKQNCKERRISYKAWLKEAAMDKPPIWKWLCYLDIRTLLREHI